MKRWGHLALCTLLRMALFFTGRKHAGENLGEVLRRRAAERDPRAMRAGPPPALQLWASLLHLDGNNGIVYGHQSVLLALSGDRLTLPRSFRSSHAGLRKAHCIPAPEPRA